jgi:hypothetical protein
MTVISTTPEQRETMRQRFSELLMSGEVARIRFRYGAFQLRPGGYTVIGMSLATRSIHAPGESAARRPMNVRVETMPPHAGAMYLAGGNIIAVPRVNYGTSPNERAAVVHESTHAIFDYNRVRLSAFEEEGCAYIADAMYQQMTGEALHAGARAHRTIAWEIAGGLVAPHRLMRPWTDEVTAADMQRLIAALRAEPGYAGIAARRASFRYRHDGGTL